MMKKLFKIVGYVLSGLVAVVVFTVILTQTEFFRSWLKEKVNREIGKMTSGKIEIGKLDGNLFSGVGLSDILVAGRKDTLARIKRIELSYSLPALLHKEIYLDRVLISGLTGQIIQRADSSWNFTDLFNGTAEADSDLNESSAPFDWTISLNELRLEVDLLKIKSGQQWIPEKIEDLKMGLSGSFTDSVQTLNLQQFSAVIGQPDVPVREFRFSAVRNREMILLRDLILQTGANELTADAGIYPDTLFRSNASVYLSVPSLADLDVVVPQLKFPLNTSFTSHIEYQGDSLHIALGLQNDHQEIDAAISVKRLKVLADPDVSRSPFTLEIAAKGFDSRYWFPDQDLSYAGNFVLEADGIYHKNRIPDVKCRLTAGNLQIGGKPLDSLLIDAELISGNLDFDLDIRSGRGDAYMTGSLEDITETQKFDISAGTPDLDLSGIWLPDSIPVMLSGNVLLKGASLDPKKISGELIADFRHVKISDVATSDLNIIAEKQEGRIRIRTFKFSSNLMDFACEGTIDSSLHSGLSFELIPGNIAVLGSLVPLLNDLNMNGRIAGDVTGSPAELTGDIRFDLSGVVYDSVSVDSMTGSVQLSYCDSLLTGEGHTELRMIRNPSMTVENVRLAFVAHGSGYDIQSRVELSPDIDLTSTFQVVPDTVLRIIIPAITINAYGTRWTSQNANTRIVIANSSYKIYDFDLQSPGNDSRDDARLFIDGTVDLYGEQDLNVDLENFNLEFLDSLLADPLQLKGILHTHLNLTGLSETPVLKGAYSIGQGMFRKQRFRQFSGGISIADSEFIAQASLDVNGSDSLHASIAAPVIFSIKDGIFGFPVRKGGGITLSTSGISLGVLLAGIPAVRSAEGWMVCDMTITDTPSGYELNGTLSLDNGALQLPAYGIDYRALRFELIARQRRLTLNDFSTKSSEGGVLEMDGFIDIDQGVIDGGDLRLTADRFYVTGHKDYEIMISADAQLQVKNGLPVFGGDINLNRGNFYLPGILSQTSQNLVEGSPKKSLLMSALASETPAEGPEENGVKEPALAADRPGLFSAFISRLEGRLRLQFNRNVWVRSRDMRIELSGDLELRHDQSASKIFGQVDVERGQYDVLGKRFEITKGEVTFRGRQDLNPLVSVTAEYAFRTSQREKEYIRLIVQGELQHLQYQFYFNDTPISEPDAVSYVLFGRSKEELSYSQQSDMASSVQGEIGMGIVSNILSDRLSRSLGEDLSLDIIEVNARDNWKSATFMVGKYLTENLFLTYERSFGEGDQNVTNPETISLEYQVSKSFFLQLIQGDAKVSGLDMFFKIEW